ncbi:MAG TPA: sigma-70 family RNA polymerase sigma factor [Candidatus Baltobacteraceae bacterium]|jgi:RNA polymerase sigma factor (sigma-70 family)|nr:sigma-70 family RNA polymerase sigma factor [Candidatus Baltobacteraceae bacterium]
MTKYAYLRSRAARKFYRPGLDRADLEQTAAIGLIKACDRYNSDLETPFEAYAWLLIVGELMHYVRDHERLVRALRKVRALERRFQEIGEVLVHELGREPTIEEQARRAGCTRREADEVRVYRERAVPQCLDGLDTFAHLQGSRQEQVDDYLLVESALEVLNRSERAVILAFYALGYTQAEIAKRLGYSRRHVSRLHRAALKKMHPACVAPSGALGTSKSSRLTRREK